MTLPSAGSCLALAEEVLGGRLGRGMALVRPPGHHAMKDESCGYCLVNNVALCARRAQDHGMARVLILDWDVHHGQVLTQMTLTFPQGTQREFYEDSGVLYISIHRCSIRSSKCRLGAGL